jgi:hypothetical protein
MSSSITTTSLKALSPHFQRSINLVYDARDADYVSGYIPTPNGAEVLMYCMQHMVQENPF